MENSGVTGGQVTLIPGAWSAAKLGGASWDEPGFGQHLLGRALVDLGVHAADVLTSVLGDDAVEVCALLSWSAAGASAQVPAKAGPEASRAVEEIAQLVVRFAGGAVGTLQASWALAAGSDHQLTIQGSLGTLHLDERTPATLVTGGGRVPVRLSVPEQPPTVFSVFVEAIESAAPPAVTAADGRATIALVEAAYRSAVSGRVERVESAVARGDA